MSRIQKAFENKKAFIAFLTAGDPSLDKTEEYILEMERAGADLIEIGIPIRSRRDRSFRRRISGRFPAV